MIKFLDLKKINKPYDSAFQDKLKQVLDNGWYILGSELQDFERNFALYCGTKYCIGVGNGFDALLLLKLLASATNSLSALHVIEAASVSIPPV